MPAGRAFKTKNLQLETCSLQPLTRLAHLSDVHFGAISRPEIVPALVEEVNGQDFDLVVVSGDLTQRARKWQFSEAKKMLDAFRAPTLVVPGNHDVPAWWHNPFARVFRSADRFRRLLEDDMTPTFVRPGLAVFGLNSAHGLTIKGGKIRARHIREMRRFFEEQLVSAARVLVLHHHLLRLQALGSHDVARGAKRALHAAQEVGVDLILCGHLHTSVVEHVETVDPDGAGGHRVIVASAGTATSHRGRRGDQDVNFYNWITIDEASITVQERRFDPDAGRYVLDRESRFERLKT